MNNEKAFSTGGAGPSVHLPVESASAAFTIVPAEAREVSTRSLLRRRIPESFTADPVPPIRRFILVIHWHRQKEEPRYGHGRCAACHSIGKRPRYGICSLLTVNCSLLFPSAPSCTFVVFFLFCNYSYHQVQSRVIKAGVRVCSCRG
jgi:hypothetical protein